MNFPQKENKDVSALESIEHELYDPKVQINATEIHHVRSKRTLDLPTSWDDNGPILIKSEKEKGLSFGVKLLIASTLLLVAALAFSAWRVLLLRNVVSAENIDMTADVTPYIEGGESTPLVLTLRNRNTAVLEGARVTMLYKQGIGSEDELEKVQETRDIGPVKSGEFKRQDFSITLYGSENETRDIMLKLEYKVLGSSAMFNKIVTTKVVLRTPQVSVHVNGPKTLSVGQSGTYSFVVTNNSATSSLPSVLKLTLPNSFTADSSTPSPVSRGTTWSIRPLAPGASTTITVIGSFAGKQGEVATIQAKVGSLGDSSDSIGIVYSSESKDVILRTSPITLLVNLSSDTGTDEVLRYGDKAIITLAYSNSSDKPLEDVSLTLALSGDAALYDAVIPTNGYYDSVKKEITWDKATLPDLAVLAPNAQGTLRVVIPIVSKGNNSPTLKTTFTGTGSTQSSEDVVATVSKTFAVQGIATLVASTQYKTSPFQNTGPIPPQPNQTTTYTAHLAVIAQNTLRHVQVSFTLPVYASWRSLVSDPSITYNSRTRTVTWNIDHLDQGTSRTADIGISVKPSQSQVGGSPAITSGIILDAEEEVSGVHLKTTLSPLTTALHAENWAQNPNIVVDK